MHLMTIRLCGIFLLIHSSLLQRVLRRGCQYSSGMCPEYWDCDQWRWQDI